MASLLERVAELSAEKRRLLAQRNPLSFAQERIWFLDQLEPGSPFYSVPAAVRLSGALRADLFARSLGEVVRRHQVLRTTFPTFDGRALQLVAPAAAVAVPVVDLTALPPAARGPEARRWAEREARRPFDLARGPLLRCALLRLADADHFCILTLHHIVCDGWSIEILIREVAALYAAFHAGRPSPLPELAIQYADFARWQRERLRGERLAAELAHWRGELAGIPASLELPGDRPRPAVRLSRGARRPVRLSAGALGPLLARAREQGATPFMVLLAGFAALLHRLSGQPELVVGTPVVNRGRVEVEPLIGLFLNTLALRVRLGDDPTFRQLVGRVREVVLAAQAHQELPFEKLVEELQPERDLSGNPLFQVMFTLKSAPWKRLSPAGLAIEPLEIDAGTSKLDLTLSLIEESGVLRGALEYSSDLFDATTIERLLGGFDAILAAAARDPELRAAQLPVLSEAERHQVEVEWSEGWEAGAGEALVHERVAAQAARRAEALA
ncbi:MAG TPA: condensation domain-containing protein, partial [Thermoanaerobaculia bacterium]|nr:condensation domain-containing protein [Thermoanaerobaculia bacterium]